jgi:DNA-binding MarR family transcriptional regulator
MAADRKPKRSAKGTDGGSPGKAAGLRGIPGYLEEDGPPTLDRLVHERVRLGVLSALAVNLSLSFTELKDLLKTTDGNLSVHARKLEDAAYVRCVKSFEGRFPKTEYELTKAGQQALARYLDHMEALIHATRKGKGAPS